MKLEQINEMIEWGKEEKQPDFAEFIEFIRDRHADQKPIIVAEDDVETEYTLYRIILHYKKPFPDFDVSLYFVKDGNKDKRIRFAWEYTYMDKFKKIADNMFCITGETGKETFIRLK